MPAPLTPRRAAVLAFIRERAAALGQPPSLAEIAAACGLASRGAARKHVLALAEAGLVETTAGQARSVRPSGLRPNGVPRWTGPRAVPVLGRVAAGAPIGADAGVGDTLLLDPQLFATAPDYLLRVRGDSMIDDGILDGDLVGVKRAVEARDGQVVVARLEGELTIKRLAHRDGALRLLPRNPAYAPIEVRPDQDFAIEGVFCGLVRRG